MSKEEGRYEWRDAIAEAWDVCGAITDHVLRVDVAGSLRRKKTRVGDIDLVAALDPENPWARIAPVNALVERGYSVEKEGDQIVTLTPPVQRGGPKVDLYLCTLDTFGIIFLIRTGSRAHNVKLSTMAGRRLPARKLTHKGIVNTAGIVIASKTEEEVFTALGMPYLEPEHREAPEYEETPEVEG